MKLAVAIVAILVTGAACNSGGHAPVTSTMEPSAIPWRPVGRGATVTPTPEPPDVVVQSFDDALADATFYLTRNTQPGVTIDGVESVRYVKTTVGEVKALLRNASRIDPSWPPEDEAWLFVEYGQIGWVSIHGGFHGEEGAIWVLAPRGYAPAWGEGSVDLTRLGQPTTIGLGESGEIDRKRITNSSLVQTKNDAIEAVARLLPHIQATLGSIHLVSTTVARAEVLRASAPANWPIRSAISLSGLPSDDPAWVFELTGDFQLVCGRDFHDARSDLQLIVVEGTSAPFVIETSSSRFPTPTPLPTLAEFGQPEVIAPGQSAAIDQFRASADEIAGRATALAATPVVLCASQR